MTGEIIILLLGTFILSTSITFIAWTRVRVLWLRQDLFEIRDRLFDQAADLGAFRDPAYRQCRQYLNGLLSIAEFISFRSVEIPAKCGVKLEPFVRIDPRVDGLRGPLDEAYEKMTQRLMRYLTRHTLGGLALHLTSKARATKLRHAVMDQIRSRLPFEFFELQRSGKLGYC